MTHEQRSDTVPFGKILALVGAQHRQHGGQRVGLHASRVHHGHARQRMGDGLAGARVDGVRPALAFMRPLVPAVAGGRDGHVRQRDALRGGQAAVDLHLPRLSARTPSDAPQLTADFEQEVGQPQRLQRLRTMVDREALGDAGKIERNTAWLRQRNIGRIESQPTCERASASA
jgi:hypothetical protein